MLKLTPRKVPGVFAMPGKGWRVRIQHKNVSVSVGCYATYEEAVAADAQYRTEHGIRFKELLGEPLVSQLHPTKNGESMAWPFTGSNETVWWLCSTCGHEWPTAITTRATGTQTGCPECGKKKQAAAKLLPLRITWPVMTTAHLLPMVSYPGSKAPWLSICMDCGEWVTPIYNNVQQTGRGCVYCAPSTFDVNRDGYLYLLQHRFHFAAKVGISNVPKQRICQLHSHGWDTHSAIVLGPFDGRVTVDLENAIHAGWRNQGFKAVSFLEDTSGWTETVSLWDVPWEALLETMAGCESYLLSAGYHTFALDL